MNDTPTTAPIPTTDSTVTPTAPLTDVAVAPVAAPTTVADQAAPTVRGRVASPRTVAIRQMLEDTDGEITFSVANPLLTKLGFTVDENTFNVTKSAWKRAKRPDAPKANTAPKTTRKATAKPRKVAKVVKPARKVRELPEVTIADAIAFVQTAGGVEKAQAGILRNIALLKAFKALVKQTSKLAA